MNLNRLLVVTGVGLLGAGILALTVPGVLALGVGQPVIWLIAALSLVLAVRAIQARRRTEFQQASTGTPEYKRSAPRPGQTLNDAFKQFLGAPHGNYRYRTREGLAAAARAVITRYTDSTLQEAREHIQDGSWTDDPAATAFFTGDDYRPRLSRRIRAVLPRGTEPRREVNRTVDAITAVAGIAHDTGSHDEPNPEPTATQSSDHPSGEVEIRRQTGYWTGISVVTLLSLGVGVFTEQAGILLVGVVGIVVAAYSRSSAVTGEGLTVERSLGETQPAPDEHVEVTVTVSNDGEQTLPDVRLVDGVPAALSVADGTPRSGAVLRPGASVEFTYTVTARRGVHEFGPVQAIVRNAPGAIEYERTVSPESPTTVTCIPPQRSPQTSPPLRRASTPFTGTAETTSAGDGTEFYATRRYQPGDPLGRIDWNRTAKTGEFATLLFREERTASVVILVDTSAYFAPEPHTEHALDRAVDGAGHLFEAIQQDGHLAGIGALERSDCWLAPGTGRAHRIEASELLATHPALAPEPDDHHEDPNHARQVLYSRLPADSQVVVLTPLCRSRLVRTIRRLDAAGHPVTVVSPDPTGESTPGQRLAAVGRQVHITDLRQDGIPVLDWGWDESLATALAQFQTRAEVMR